MNLIFWLLTIVKNWYQNQLLNTVNPTTVIKTVELCERMGEWLNVVSNALVKFSDLGKKNATVYRISTDHLPDAHPFSALMWHESHRNRVFNLTIYITKIWLKKTLKHFSCKYSRTSSLILWGVFISLSIRLQSRINPEIISIVKCSFSSVSFSSFCSLPLPHQWFSIRSLWQGNWSMPVQRKCSRTSVR